MAQQASASIFDQIEHTLKAVAFAVIWVGHFIERLLRGKRQKETEVSAIIGGRDGL